MASNKFTRIQLRRDSKENLRNINPILREGEPIVELDTGKMKIGDGKSTWNELQYSNEVPSRITDYGLNSLIAKDENGNTIDIDNNIIPDGCKVDTIEIAYDVTNVPKDAYILIGDTKITEVIFNGKLMKIIDIIDISNNGILTITLPNGEEIASNTTIKFVIETYDEKIVTEEISIVFGYTVYAVYGDKEIAIDENGNLTEDAESKIVTSREVVYKLIPPEGNNNYMHFYLPDAIYDNYESKYGLLDPIFTDQASGFSGGFMLYETCDIANEYKVDGKSSYKHYISANRDLGTVTIFIQ